MYSAQPTTLLIEGASTKLFTIVYQKPEAESVLLLHGGPGVPMDFSDIAEPLSRKYQVIIFEQRGTGRSPVSGGAYSIEEYIQDIDAVAQHFGVEKIHIFGHSWGGLYAQIYAEIKPQRVLSMFLSSPSSGTGQQWSQVEREVMAFNKSRAGSRAWSVMGIKSLLGMLGYDRAYQSLFKQVLENYLRDFDGSFLATDEMVENVRAEAINKTRASILEYPLLNEIATYDIPILVAYGEKDVYGKSKQHVKTRFPNAKFVEYARAGHIPWKNNSTQFSASLTEFYQLL